MCKINKLPLAITAILFFIPFLGCEQDLTSDEKITNVSAPILGITSSSVILLWDDTYSPDYTDKSGQQEERLYYIFRNGIKIDSTRQRSYPTRGLAPATLYDFDIQIRDGQQAFSKSENAIQITTKAAGSVFNVRDFGAHGDGIHHDALAIQKTIDACTTGGTVLIPAGDYRVGHITLKSDMTLELDKNAVLSFDGYMENGNYPITKAILPGPDGDIDYESSSLITGYKVTNVTITGEGTINGNGETWWPHYKNKEVRRPFTIQFIQSSNILVQGITVQDPPKWNNHLLYVDHAIYSNVKFLQVSKIQGHNGDGLNPDASRNILIVGCLFGNQDDSIAIKSGKYVDDGNKRRRSCEYITIRDCVFDGNAAPGSNPLGIGIGSETSGGVRHIVIKNCEFKDAASLINIKTNRQRVFAVVEDIMVENIRYTNSKHSSKKWNRAPISIDMFYYATDGDLPSVAAPFTKETPVFRDFHFRNIFIDNAIGKGIYISGFAESLISDISFEKVLIRSRDGIMIQNTGDMDMRGIQVWAQNY